MRGTYQCTRESEDKTYGENYNCSVGSGEQRLVFVGYGYYGQPSPPRY